MKFLLQTLTSAFSRLRVSPCKSTFSNIAKAGIATPRFATHGRQFSSLPVKPSSSILPRIDNAKKFSPTEHRRFFSDQADGPEFTLTIYSINAKGTYNGLPQTDIIPGSKQTIKKVCDLVASHLKVSDEWDKKVIESVLFERDGTDWFEFVKTEIQTFLFE